MGLRPIRYSLPRSNGRPTHDIVDAPSAGYCVAAHCHPNAIGPARTAVPPRTSSTVQPSIVFGPRGKARTSGLLCVC